MVRPVLYCSDPLRPRRVDAHFAAEAAAVRACGAVVALLDHDALLAGDLRRAVGGVPAGLGAAWYRGWMIPAGRYTQLAEALAERGGGLVVGPDQYRAAHEFPGWYRCFAALTPASVWRPCQPGEPITDEALADLAAGLPPGPGIVKDYVKSRKHDWDEACFIPDLTDLAGLRRVVQRFLDLQDESLAGGIVLRAYEDFVRPETTAAEARVWWRDAQPAVVTAHPDSPHLQPPALPDLAGPDLAGVGLAGLGRAVAALGCRWITTDLALRRDGVWRVVEVGDAQVCDLHPAADEQAFAAALTAA